MVMLFAGQNYVHEESEGGDHSHESLKCTHVIIYTF
jgi:hypothetical protein